MQLSKVHSTSLILGLLRHSAMKRRDLVHIHLHIVILEVSVRGREKVSVGRRGGGEEECIDGGREGEREREN